MAADQDKLLSPTMLKARNKILIEYADLSFSDAQDEVMLSLKSEKDNSTRLALLAAKSWIIRKCTNELLFDTVAEEIWKNALKEMDGEYKQMIHYPLDPQLN